MTDINNITKPSITRLGRRAGVKSLSEGCYPLLKQLINNELEKVLSTATVINSEHTTITLMPNDVYNSLHFLGYNVTVSNDLNTTTCSK